MQVVAALFVVVFRRSGPSAVPRLRSINRIGVKLSMDLPSLWEASSGFQELLDTLSRRSRQAHVVGLSQSARRHLMAAVLSRVGGPGVVVGHHTGHTERIAEDLRTFLPDWEVLSWPANPYLPYEVIARSPDIASQRLAVLRRLERGNLERVCLVATAEAMVGRLTPADVFRAATLEVAVGAQQPVGKLLPRLLRLGYEREDRVAARGQFALRGGILDVWDMAEEAPYRLEFFDDLVESIRYVDVASQRSRDSLETVRLGPVRELVIDDAAHVRGLSAMHKELRGAETRLRHADKGDAAQHLRGVVEEDLDRFSAFPGAGGESLERYQALFYPRPGHILTYFPMDSAPVVLWDEPARVRETAQALERDAAERASALLERGEILPGQGEAYLSIHEMEQAARAGVRVAFSSLLSRGQSDLGEVVSFSAKAGEVYHGRWDDFLAALEHHRSQGRRIVITAQSSERCSRIAEALRGRDVPVRLMPPPAEAAPVPREVVIVLATLEGGYSLPDMGLCVFTDAEIQGRRRRHTRSAQASGPSIRLGELALGDVVVHAHHGIGRYVGMKPMLIDGHEREYLELEFAAGDRVYVPTDQITQIQKYVGSEGKEPKLSKLGGADWHRTKAKVKESVRDMAAELIRLYAAREALPGHAFGADTPWQQELEESFPYEETPDQVRCIAEIKADMERPRPMDRLLCGDVGFGKTEVAIRAAFKAVADGRQVAVLVPTTILAQQHFRTFEERLRGLPVRVELLSRFRTPREQAQTLRRAHDGTADIVIGTHRLLGKDVVFKNLGLLVVDEEQRFGVAQKERIKQLATGIDSLTLTATPIPRTLQFSLFGLRDVSLIETPPEDRFPVQTYVVEMSDDLVGEAIRREVGRGGQVFYVNNRIEGLDSVLLHLRRLVPEVRLAVAHGRMHEDQLERTMIDFLEGEHDVLVATSIIESGLDMPRVNTLIVENADHLGLSQLYQLRGRVGRSNRLAYAYFTYQRDRALSEIAEKRLSAIQQFTDFGAGFQIAMRDLEIRGAGNILGAEQHGFLMSVGFDMYRQLLEEAIEELRGDAKRKMSEEEVQAVVEIALDAYIPNSYMSDSRDKMDAYRRIAAIRDPRTVDDIEAEFQDRFGPVPSPTNNLLQVARIRTLAQAASISFVREESGRTILGISSLASIDGAGMARLTESMRGQIRLEASVSQVLLTIRHPGETAGQCLDTIVGVLRELAPMPDEGDLGQAAGAGHRGLGKVAVGEGVGR